MATELQNSLKKAAEKVADYVDNVATLTVETQYVHIGLGADVNFGQAKPVARTVIKIDGDCQTVVPMQEDKEKRLEVDTALFELHQQNVATAIEYRARIMNALLSTLQQARK